MPDLLQLVLIILIMLDTKDYKENFQIHNIKHVKIPLYSAWVRSTWERMINTIKQCLYKTIGCKIVDYFTLLTVSKKFKMQ